MPRQSTNSILLIKPASFYSNEQTAGTNLYQHSSHGKDKDKIFDDALIEFNNFEHQLKKNQILVTTLEGQVACPDNIYPNWFITFENKTMNLFSMLAENRRLEKSESHISFLNQTYKTTIDYSDFEKDTVFLEGTSSMVLDRVNKVAYMGLSSRSNEELAQQWTKDCGFKLITFETKSHFTEPIYHTDIIMYIGTDIVVICTDSIQSQYQSQVIERLNKHHQVLEISEDQVLDFCGNSLEVRDTNDNLKVVMSTAAFNSFTTSQKKTLLKYYTKIIHSNLETIEKYGGGSARCMMTELF
jgi:hypothetical protein